MQVLKTRGVSHHTPCPQLFSMAGVEIATEGQNIAHNISHQQKHEEKVPWSLEQGEDKSVCAKGFTEEVKFESG